jgi:hypothetical protein
MNPSFYTLLKKYTQIMKLDYKSVVTTYHKMTERNKERYELQIKKFLKSHG